MDQTGVDTLNSVVDETRDAIQRCLEAAIESLRTATPVAKQRQDANNSDGPIKVLASRIEELSIKLDGLHQMPNQMNQYRKFLMRNPLKLLSEGEAWDSPQVLVGGPNGYRVGIRVLMSGGGFAHARCVSILFRVFRGPYDAWLRWPFPGKSVTFAMFRLNGKPPYAETCRIEHSDLWADRPSVDRPLVCASKSHFIPIEKVLDDRDFISRNAGPNADDDVLMVGFALEGEDAFVPHITSSLEARVEHLEQAVARNNPYLRFNGHNHEDDPFLEDSLHCY